MAIPKTHELETQRERETKRRGENEIKSKKGWIENPRSAAACGYGDSAEIRGQSDGGGTVFGSDSGDGDNDNDDDEEREKNESARKREREKEINKKIIG